MIVNTRRLFARLLSDMQIGVVCDVGSMNGADALAFTAAAPHSSVYALEPNPVNFRLMAADRALRRHNIRIAPLAASNYDGEAEFYLVAADYARADPRRGMSSLHRREGECAPATIVRVRTTRLDSFLADKCSPGCRLALWIDAEGVAYEVIEGLSGVIAQVQLLHIEVETWPCIGARQRLYPEVKSLLAELGFTELATDQAPSHEQFNALFIRTALPAALRLRVRVWLARARLRHLAAGVAVRVLQACCPKCLRRYQATRLRTMRLRCP
jgi:FkbM family methyltransferase